MSTDIKPGQVWAWQDTDDARGPHGTTFEIIDASPNAPDVAYQYRDAAGMDQELMRAAPAEVVRANANLVRCACRAGTEDACDQHSATPAPLDPKQVHVGDTVTVRFIPTGDVFTTKAYQPEDVTKPGEWVYVLGWPLNKPMGHGLGITYFEILAIEPAPEPEPVWEPGTVGTATVSGYVTRVMRTDGTGGADAFWVTPEIINGTRAHQASSVTDFEPDGFGVLAADVERLRKKAEKWGSGDLPSGLTITLDGGVLNWRGQNYVRQGGAS